MRLLIFFWLLVSTSCKAVPPEVLVNTIPVVGFYNNSPKEGYPLAIFNVSGTYLGIATNSAGVVTLWNADATNSALGTIAVTSETMRFTFNSPKNKTVSYILGASISQISSSLTLIGTSYFTSYAQTAPYLYDKIKDFWGRTLTGYTTQNGLYGNNGKVAHDRIKASHHYIDGISNTDAIMQFWNCNDMLYQSTVSGGTLKPERTIMKVVNSHYTCLGNAFSKSFHYFVDETNTSGTITSFADSDYGFASKSYQASKNITVLNSNGAYIQFNSIGPTNIVYFVSDSINLVLGTIEIYVNDLLYQTIDCNGKTIYLGGQNPSVPTGVGDTTASPNSIVLPLSKGQINKIKVVRTSASNAVWLDYWSEIETDMNKGAKPVYIINAPKYTDGASIPISGGGNWTADDDIMIAINTGLTEVVRFWHDDLGAPVFLADVYTGWVPTYPGGDVVSDLIHMSQAGTDKVLTALNEKIKKGFGGNYIKL